MPNCSCLRLAGCMAVKITHNIGVSVQTGARQLHRGVRCGSGQRRFAAASSSSGALLPASCRRSREMEQAMHDVEPNLVVGGGAKAARVRFAVSTLTKISPCWNVITSVGPAMFMNCLCNAAMRASETSTTSTPSRLRKTLVRAVGFIARQRAQGPRSANRCSCCTSTRALCVAHCAR